MKITSDATDATDVALGPVGVREGARTTSPALPSEFGLTKYLDPLRIPPRIVVPAGNAAKSLKITMQSARVRLHSQLEKTRVWTYNGSFPGPTIEVRRGRNLHVTWDNAIDDGYPVTAVQVPAASATPGPGRDGVEPREAVAEVPAWTVVHLHGARTNAWNDGWTENAMLCGSQQLSEYPNDQRATTLWYHDHASGITSLNVMAGLVGMYLIRDEEEDALDLPSGRYEVPLILCDRNLDTDSKGAVTSRLLYKQAMFTPEIPIPFTGPFNLVNGVIWPHLEVEARWYRFRLLNASNARFYRLELRDQDGKAVKGAMKQIGTDGGFLGKPAAIDDLTLAPGERADVLVDFSAFRGTSPTLVNTFVPARGTSLNPDVMQFRVRSARVRDRFVLPETVSKSFVRLTHDDLPHTHAHRWILTVFIDGRHPEMWEMNEIDEAPPPGSDAVDGLVQVKLRDGTVKTLQRASRSFRDAANFYVELDGWEIWNILNLSFITHPIHLHLVEFQTIGLGRQRFDIDTFDTAKGGTTSPVTFNPQPIPLDASDQGSKDVIRVGLPPVPSPNPGEPPKIYGELVTIAARFTGGTGRFMYHCHILEHEDEGMMSTFIVTPKEVMAVDPMHGPMHGAGHSHGS